MLPLLANNGLVVPPCREPAVDVIQITLGQFGSLGLTTPKYFRHQSQGLFAQFTVHGGETGEEVVVVHIFFFFLDTEEIAMFPHDKAWLQ